MIIKYKIRKLRGYSILAITILTLSGAFFHFSWGTLSSFGYETISAICPLAFLEVSLASRTFIPRLLIGLGVTLVVTLLLGRVFCAWACPIPHVRSWFVPRKSSAATNRDAIPASTETPQRTLHILPQPGTPSAPPQKHSPVRYYVLSGVLLSSGFFGFPVFCLICPIGLFFGTLFAIMRLLRFNEPTMLILIFPIILIIELTLFRNWCGKFCPIGAILSLISRFNKTFIPTIDREKCLITTKNIKCHACTAICPENIDLHCGKPYLDTGLCTKCGDCIDICPVSAIHLFEKDKINDDTHGTMQKTG